MVRGLVPLAPIKTSSAGIKGPKPRRPTEIDPTDFYFSLSAITRATIRFSKTYRVDFEGDGELTDGYNLVSLISGRNFETADSASACANPGGPRAFTNEVFTREADLNPRKLPIAVK